MKMTNGEKISYNIPSLAVLAVIFAGCMLFFDVVGICGKIGFLQETSRIFTVLGVPITLPPWFLLGWLSGTLLVLCGYGIYRLKSQKKQYGMLISRQLLLAGAVLRSAVTSGGIYRRSSRLVFYYLDGSKIQTRKTSLYLTDENSGEIKKALEQIARISISSPCNQALIAEKYRTILPELQDPKEKFRYLLTHDIGDMKQAF